MASPQRSTSDRDGTQAGSRRAQIIGLLVTGLVVAGLLIAVLGGGNARQLRPGQPVPGATAVRDLLAGIPQRGERLGNPKAPLTLVEYGDLQCPSCALFAQDALPKIISAYVRKGLLMLQLRPLHFIGADSLRAARLALALGEQKHLWDFAELMYRNQGVENTSYVTDTYLRALASAIIGADVAQAMRQRASSSITTAVQDATASSQRLGLRATPSFLLGRTAQPMHTLTPQNISEAASFEGPLNRALEQIGR